MRNSIVLARTIAITLTICVVAVGLPTMAQTAHTCRNIPTIITIDYPGGFQTQPAAISNTGWITGGRLRSDGNNHCFLRSPSGGYSDCEPAGVGAIASFGWSINAEGTIAGVYRDSNRAYHGFLRYASGLGHAPLDAPGAGTGANQGTTPYNINPSGELYGQSIDDNNVNHGWSWVATPPPNGTFTVFDAPGAGTGAGQGTVVPTVDGLDPFGNLVGAAVDNSNVYHGFVRNADGSFRCTFEVPGAGTGAGDGTFASGINQAGTIAGAWADNNGVLHGFVGPACGTLTPFDVPGAGTGPNQGTQSGTINALGEVAAFYIDSNNVNHGFVREPNGMITRFDAPGAGTGSGQGTFSLSNNALSQVTGWYADSLGMLHGFLRSCP